MLQFGYKYNHMNLLFWLASFDFRMERAKGSEPSYPAWGTFKWLLSIFLSLADHKAYILNLR